MNKKVLLLITIFLLIVSIFAIKNITLAANNVQNQSDVVAKQKIGEEEKWKYNFELPKYDENGKLIVYEIDEENVPENYTKSIEGNTIKNTLNKYNYKVEYYYNGELDASKTDSINTFYGTKIDQYTDKSITGFKLEKVEGLGLIVGNNEQTNTIKVYYTTERATLSGTKIWKDDNNSQGLRPENYCIKLYANGKYLDRKNFKQDEPWSFTNLQKYDSKTGKEIVYTVQEDEIVLKNGDKYIPTINGTQVINTLTGTTQIEVKKVWEDNENINNTRPENIVLTIKKILSK